MNDKSLLMLIKTNGLDYDDRLRKECLSLSSKWKISISCIEKRFNKKQEKKVFNGIPAKTHRIISRDKFEDGKGIVFKAIECYCRLFWDVCRKRPQVVWIHDPDLVLLVFLALLLRKVGIIEKVIWDHHELPYSFKSRIYCRLLAMGINRVDGLICTNPFRLQYLKDYLKVNPRVTGIVENYPDRVMRDAGISPLPEEISDWLAGNPYVLVQGGGRPDRCHQELVEACARVGVRLIVVGSVTPEKIQCDHVFYTDQIPQMDIMPITDHCLASIVLYKDEKINSLYCSPNRLFQALARGKPVLVGNNPPMKQVVSETGTGVVLPSDGSDIADIENGLTELLADIERYARAASDVREKFVWEEQGGVLQNVASGE